MTFFGGVSSTAAATLASARATASTSSGVADAGTTMWLRTLPLTCTGYSTDSSTSSAGSASGNGT